jgi:hypothetical protein
MGGLDFHFEKYLDRDCYMDGTFILAEELAEGLCYYEAYILLSKLIEEEKKAPYFRHFFVEVLDFHRKMYKKSGVAGIVKKA